MLGTITAFDEILENFLIPEYRQGAFFKSAFAEFRETKRQFGQEDARNFVLGWEAGLIKHIGGGKYKGVRNGPAEKFFNADKKTIVPRTFALAQESVITDAVLARLHFEFGWPKELLGTQSVDSAFDAVTFLPGASNEYIACEVKRTSNGIDKMIREMQTFCDPSYRLDHDSSVKEAHKNALRKVHGLRRRRARVFWAVGPYGSSKVFSVSYLQDGSIVLSPESEATLAYPLISPSSLLLI